MDSAQAYINPQYQKDYNPEKTDKRKWGKIVLIIVLALGFYLLKTQWWDKPVLVTVIGEGKITIKPQRASLTVGITNLSTSSAQTKVGNDLKTRSLKDILKKFGVKDADISLEGFKVVAVTGNGNTSQQVFQGVSSASINLYDPSKLDNLVSQLKNQNFQNITNINFSSSSPDQDEKSVLADAISDGKVKAGKLRKQLSRFFVGRLSSVTIISQSTTQNEISKTATLVFELH